MSKIKDFRMKYYQVTYNWVQAVSDDGWVLDAWRRGETLTIIRQKEPDALGPRVGQEISKSKFNKQFNEIRKSLTT